MHTISNDSCLIIVLLFTDFLEEVISNKPLTLFVAFILVFSKVTQELTMFTTVYTMGVAKVVNSYQHRVPPRAPICVLSFSLTIPSFYLQNLSMHLS
jgi:hypothetical protein